MSELEGRHPATGCITETVTTNYNDTQSWMQNLSPEAEEIERNMFDALHDVVRVDSDYAHLEELIIDYAVKMGESALEYERTNKLQEA